MATTGGRDEMRTPVENDLPLGRCAVETWERSERVRPAVLGVLLLAAASILIPGAPQWVGFSLGCVVILIDARFRSAAYKFVGSPNTTRRDTAEFWSLTSMAYVLFTLPVLGLTLTYQVIANVAGFTSL